jgi:NAD-dependent deacetylase
MDKGLSKLKSLVKDAKYLVAFTGAGLSAESGIPTYRGVGGLWTKYDPAKYANIDYFRSDPSYYWSFFRDVRYPMMKQAQPNAAHYALVELENRGSLDAVITQNIDGLHQIAGNSRVIELHGSIRRIVCIDCGSCFTMDAVYDRLADELPPRCSCTGMLRPDTVFFGEPLSQGVLDEAAHVARNCDLFLVVGSSLVVYPAAQLPVIAEEAGAHLIIVNIDPTPLDAIADVVIHDRATHVLSGLIS